MHAKVYEFKGTQVIEIMGDRTRGEVELSVGAFTAHLGKEQALELADLIRETAEDLP